MPPESVADCKVIVSAGAVEMPVMLRVPELAVTVKVPLLKVVLSAVWTALADTDNEMLAVVSKVLETVADRVKLPGVKVPPE